MFGSWTLVSLYSRLKRNKEKEEGGWNPVLVAAAAGHEVDSILPLGRVDA